MDMGETTSRLNFRVAGLTPKQAATGATAYEATAQGVTYRVVGAMIDPVSSNQRVFRAYRVTDYGNRSVPAGQGGEHRTRAAAYAQAEADLAQVLADRALAAEEQHAPVGRPAPERDRPELGPFRRLDAAFQEVEDIVRELAGPACQHTVQVKSGSVWRNGKCVDCGIEMPEFNATDDIDDLVRRIVRRAQYEVLKRFLVVLGLWTEEAKRDGERFDSSDVREMLGAVARDLGMPSSDA